jgi:hypothetical protein
MKKKLIVSLSILASAVFFIVYFLHFKADKQRSLATHENFASMPTTNPGTADPGLRQSVMLKSESAAIDKVPGALHGSSTTTLAFERNLLSDASLDSEKIQSLLFAEKFDALLDQFAHQSAMDTDASELSTLYREMLEAQLQKNKLKARIDKLVCGTQVCVGSLENGTDSEYANWAAAFFDDPKTPNYGFVNATLARDHGEFDYRFVFSTDPAADSITIPRRHR